MLWEESEGRAAAGDGGGGVLYASVAGWSAHGGGWSRGLPNIGARSRLVCSSQPGHRTQFPSVATQVSTREHAHGNTQHSPENIFTRSKNIYN